VLATGRRLMRSTPPDATASRRRAPVAPPGALAGCCAHGALLPEQVADLPEGAKETTMRMDGQAPPGSVCRRAPKRGAVGTGAQARDRPAHAFSAEAPRGIPHLQLNVRQLLAANACASSARWTARTRHEPVADNLA